MRSWTVCVMRSRRPRTRHQLELQEVVVAAIVHIEEQAVTLPGAQLQLQGRVRRYEPLAELSVGRGGGGGGGAVHLQHE
jgi:hypothetical protein